jgi:ABC-type polysaccharide/polyol phosphate export permease
MPILPRNAGNLPRLGFGLWRYPYLSAAVEFALVLLGAYLYWRAAQQTTAFSASSVQRRANLTAFLILFCGILVLVLDFTGILG